MSVITRIAHRLGYIPTAEHEQLLVLHDIALTHAETQHQACAKRLAEVRRELADVRQQRDQANTVVINQQKQIRTLQLNNTIAAPRPGKHATDPRTCSTNPTTSDPHAHTSRRGQGGAA